MGFSERPLDSEERQSTLADSHHCSPAETTSSTNSSCSDGVIAGSGSGSGVDGDSAASYPMSGVDVFVKREASPQLSSAVSGGVISGHQLGYDLSASLHNQQTEHAPSDQINDMVDFSVSSVKSDTHPADLSHHNHHYQQQQQQRYIGNSVNGAEQIDPNKSASFSPVHSDCDTEQADIMSENRENSENLNALQRLQNALEKNGAFNMYSEDSMAVSGGGTGEIYQCHLCSYTGSSKFNFSQHMHSHYDFQCSHCDFKTQSNVELKEHTKIEHNMEVKDFMDEPGVRIPRVNASGKIRLHKCKFCEYKTPTQLEHWEHLKSHIPPEKRFWCHVCPFITDVKHHLTYHLRNHFNSKPFKCNKCEYSCVNKSMLSSHMKSHTNFYQYRCADCSFAAKYANALKNHLRKEQHRPGMVLNPDGSPNPFVIIDVYGTRRGPKIKKDDNGMPILPTSIQENYVNFVQNQNNYINSSSNQPLPLPPSFVSPFIQSEMTSSDNKLASLSRSYFKCEVCPFSTADRELLAKHMLNHMTPTDNQNDKHSPMPAFISEEDNYSRNNGVEHMGLLRSALAQPARAPVSPAALPTSSPAHQGDQSSSASQFNPIKSTDTTVGDTAATESSCLPQYDPITAQRVREYFSRALQTPLLYNLSMAAGLNHGGAATPFNVSHSHVTAHIAAAAAAAAERDQVRVSSPASSPQPLYYDHHRSNGDTHDRSPSLPPTHMSTVARDMSAEGSDGLCDEALDLSRLGKRNADVSTMALPAKHRRKGRAQRLEVIARRLQGAGPSPPPAGCSLSTHSDDDSPANSSGSSAGMTAAAAGGSPSSSGSIEPRANAGHHHNHHEELDEEDEDWRAAAHTCRSCGIAFKDLVMYTMHMGFHDFRRPFSCNKCGEECRDAIAFFLHIARVPHTS